MQVDVVLQRTHAATLADLHRHRTRHHVTTRQVLRRRRVALHEALALAVAQHAALATAALRHQTAHAVDARRVELHELGVLQRNARAQRHRRTVSRARVRGGGGEVAATVAARRDDRLLAVEAVDRTVLQTQRHHTHALVAVHNQVQRVVLDEVRRVVRQRAAVQRVQHGVTRTIRSGGSTIRLTALAVVLRLTSERTLVDLAVLATREGKTVRLQLAHRTRSLAAHVVNGVLVTQPVRSLHRIVEVPSPVIGVLCMKNNDLRIPCCPEQR